MENKQEILFDTKAVDFAIIKKPISKNTESVSLFYEFFLIKSGSARFLIHGEEYLVNAGEIVAVAPLTLFSVDLSEAKKVVQIKIGEKYAIDFSHFAESKILPFKMTNLHFNATVTGHLFAQFHDEELTELEKSAFSATLFSKLAKNYGLVERENKNDNLTAEIVRYIYDNYEKDVNLDTLSKEFCISKMVLSRKLSKTIGTDLRKFVGDVRVRAYIKMRSDKKYSKTTSIELAYKCGFKSYGTFYRALKRYGE